MSFGGGAVMAGTEAVSGVRLVDPLFTGFDEGINGGAITSVMEARMEALTTHLSGLAVAVVLRVARYSSAFSSLASALAVLRFFSAGGASL